MEEQIAAADKYLKAQLVERNGDNEMIFRVWSPTACGDDLMSDSDESDSDNSSAGNETEEAIVPDAIAAYPSDEAHPDFDDPHEALEDPQPSSSAHDTFKWLRVRTVQLLFCEQTSQWELLCSCGLLERTCCPCRHTFCVIKFMIQNYGIKHLRFNRRCYKGFYHKILCSADDFDVADGDCNIQVSLPNDTVQSWMLASPVASSDNVPQEGILGEINDDEGFDVDDSGNHDRDGIEPRRPDNPRRRSANVASINQDVLNIFELLGPVSSNQTGFNDFSDYLKTYGETLKRGARSAVPGRGQQNRIVGVSDLASGSHPMHHKRHASRQPSASMGQQVPYNHPALNSPTAEETRVETMRSRLRLCGVKDGNYIEVYPNYDKKGNLAVAAPGDRWFMKVVDGRVVGADT